MATELGSDLIPAVDNVTTFDTTLEVQAFNYPFTTQDSSLSLSSSIQFLGSINNDPLFGTSTAAMFLQLKPGSFPTPFSFTSRDSLIALDSAVLVLGYRSLYGDSTRPQQVQVFEMNQADQFRYDSIYQINTNNFTYSNAISGVKTFLPSDLNDSVSLFREAAVNQLRIRLNDNFGNRLLGYDSTNAYRSDSAFNTYFKGFAVVPTNNSNGNGLVGFSLADTNTKVALYYRYTKMGKPDTAVAYFRFTSRSASANYVQRNYAGSEFATLAGDENADPLVYLQNTPGTFAKLRIPGLASLSNRVVHRAELIVQQVTDPQAGIFTAPGFVYLDAYDTDAKVYRTIPFDVSVGTNGQVNAATFGMPALKTTDPAGNAISQWRFNLSRYIQHVANKTVPAYEFRLYSPYVARTNIGTSTTVQTIAINSNYAAGRVRVGGGHHPTQPMRLRIVYSKL